MPQRLRFFSGQVLTAAEFEAEQRYHREMRRLHNRLLHGVGIVEGLGVSADGGQCDAVVVAPGVVLDGLGNEIVVCDPVGVQLAGGENKTCFVTLRYAETPTYPVPTVDGGSEFTRITESFSVELTAADPCEAGNTQTLGLSRLIRQDGRWLVDDNYHHLRVVTRKTSIYATTPEPSRDPRQP